jgi:stress-induced morphogen
VFAALRFSPLGGYVKPLRTGACRSDQKADIMAISEDVLRQRLSEAFPDAEIKIDDLAGDGDHYRARIVSEVFRGLPRVRQHQLVNKALADLLSGPLHALALETVVPEAAQS